MIPLSAPPPDSPERLQAPGAEFGFALKASVGLMIGAVVVGFLWAAVRPLDLVSSAMGEVAPSSQVKQVQHLEGGIVRAFLVKEGDRVALDQPLLELEAAGSDADVQELEVRIASLTSEVAWLEAATANAEDVTFPEGFEAQYPDLAESARSALHSYRQRLENQVATQQETIAQRSEEKNQLRARITNNQRQLTTVREQLAIATDLLKDELISKLKYLDLKRESAALDGKVSEDTLALKGLEAAEREATLRAQTVRDDFAEEARGELVKKNQSLAEFTQRIGKFKDSQRRTVIRSPSEGVVKTLHVVTVGGVIPPGGLVADIVPLSEDMVIEARLPVQEVGFVAPGQEVTIRLASVASARFDALTGTVASISPDAIEDPKIGAYYRVRITTPRTAFEDSGEVYKLIPGVQVSCHIITGERSVLTYLLGPLMAGAQNALQER